MLSQRVYKKTSLIIQNVLTFFESRYFHEGLEKNLAGFYGPGTGSC